MITHNFKGYAEHKRAHDFFKNAYEQIRYSYHYINSQSLPKQELIRIFALHLSQTLIDWLNLHLNTFDSEFAAFMKIKK